MADSAATTETPESTGTPAADLAAADTLVDVSAAATPDTAAPATTEKPAESDNAANQEVTVGEGKFSVDPAVAKHIADLTAKAESKAPDGDYQLTIPDALKDQVKPDAEDPRWLALQQVAKEHNLSQDAVSAIIASHYQSEAADVTDAVKLHTEERAKMISAFNSGGTLTDEAAAKTAQGVADWAVSLLKGDIAKNPALADELAVTAQTAAGVQLLAAIKAHVGEGHTPSARDVSGNEANPWKPGKEFNLTRQGEIYRQDPDLAKTLEQQARAA